VNLPFYGLSYLGLLKFPSEVKQLNLAARGRDLHKEGPWLDRYNAQLRRGESWIQIPEKSMVVAGRAYDLNSLLNSDIISMLTGEQTPCH